MLAEPRTLRNRGLVIGKRSHGDENRLALAYRKPEFNVSLGTRISGSGCGLFKGDVIGFKDGEVHVKAHRRNNANQDTRVIYFNPYEIDDLKRMLLAWKSEGFKARAFFCVVFKDDRHRKLYEAEFELNPEGNYSNGFSVTQNGREIVECDPTLVIS